MRVSYEFLDSNSRRLYKGDIVDIVDFDENEYNGVKVVGFEEQLTIIDEEGEEEDISFDEIDTIYHYNSTERNEEECECNLEIIDDNGRRVYPLDIVRLNLKDSDEFKKVTIAEEDNTEESLSFWEIVDREHNVVLKTVNIDDIDVMLHQR